MRKTTVMGHLYIMYGNGDMDTACRSGVEEWWWSSFSKSNGMGIIGRHTSNVPLRGLWSLKGDGVGG